MWGNTKLVGKKSMQHSGATRKYRFTSPEYWELITCTP